jgi:sialate O-acetylesterase
MELKKTLALLIENWYFKYSILAMKYFLALILNVVFLNISSAQKLWVPKVFGSHMVLQRGTLVPVWGKAKPGEKITVSMTKVYSLRASKDGSWKVWLGPMPAGGPFKLQITAGKETLTFEDVLVGDVFFGVGQSNIQLELHRSENGERETAHANYPKIRFLKVPSQVSYQPEPDQQGNWERCSPASAKDFSAVQYYFGKKVHLEKNVPVGLINSSWGGTPVEAFMSLEANKSLPYHRKEAEELEKLPPGVKYIFDPSKATPQVPASIFNGMINPIIPFALKGILYYQGEHNWNNPYRFREQIGVLLNDWRIRWQQGYLPFFIVQLPANGKIAEQPSEHFWSTLRESQAAVLNYPKTGMAVAIDLGDENDLHPLKKKEVGERLALAAYSVAYDDNIVYSGPLFDSMKVAGNLVKIFFKEKGSGLAVKGKTLKGFSIASGDKKFVWAKATLVGDHVEVTAEGVSTPVAVRYSWAGTPDGNLYNKEGLPAAPFRTDVWEIRKDGTW